MTATDIVRTITEAYGPPEEYSDALFYLPRGGGIVSVPKLASLLWRIAHVAPKRDALRDAHHVLLALSHHAEPEPVIPAEPPAVTPPAPVPAKPRTKTRRTK